MIIGIKVGMLNRIDINSNMLYETAKIIKR
jgi:hypothetical protein